MLFRLLLDRFLTPRAVSLLYGPATRTTLADRLYAPLLSTPAENPILSAAVLLATPALVKSFYLLFAFLGIVFFGPWTAAIVTLALVIRGGRTVARLITFPASSQSVTKSLEKEIAARLRKKYEDALDNGISGPSRLLLLAATEKRSWWQKQQQQQQQFAAQQQQQQQQQAQVGGAAGAATPNPFTLTTAEVQLLFQAVRNIERARKSIASFARVWESEHHRDEAITSPHASVIAYYSRVLQAVLEAIEAQLFPRRYHSGNSYAQAIATSALSSAPQPLSLNFGPGLTPALINKLSSVLSDVHVLDVSAAEITTAAPSSSTSHDENAGNSPPAVVFISHRLADEAERTVRLALGLNPQKPAFEGSAAGVLASEANAQRLAKLKGGKAATATVEGKNGLVVNTSAVSSSSAGAGASGQGSGDSSSLVITVADQHHLSKALQLPRTAELLLIASSLSRRLRRLSAWIEAVPSLKVRQSMSLQISPDTLLLQHLNQRAPTTVMMTGVPKVAKLSPSELIWHGRRTNKVPAALTLSLSARLSSSASSNSATNTVAAAANAAGQLQPSSSFSFSSASSPDEVSLQLVPTATALFSSSVAAGAGTGPTAAPAAAAAAAAGELVARAIPLNRHAFADPPNLLLRLDAAMLTAANTAAAAINSCYLGTGLVAGGASSSLLPLLPLLGLDRGVVRADLVLPPKPAPAAVSAASATAPTAGSAMSSIVGRLGAAFGLRPVSTLGGAPTGSTDVASAAAAAAAPAPAPAASRTLAEPCNCGHSHGDDGGGGDDDASDAGSYEGDGGNEDDDDGDNAAAVTAVGVGPGSPAQGSARHHHRHATRKRYRLSQQEEEAPFASSEGSGGPTAAPLAATFPSSSASPAPGANRSAANTGFFSNLANGISAAGVMIKQFLMSVEANLWAFATPEPVCGLSFIRAEMLLDTHATQLFFKGASPYEVALQQLVAATDADKEAERAIHGKEARGGRTSCVPLKLKLELLWSWAVTTGPLQYLWRLLYHTPWFLLGWLHGVAGRCGVAVAYVLLPRLPLVCQALRRKCGGSSSSTPASAGAAGASAAPSPSPSPSPSPLPAHVPRMSPYVNFLLSHPAVAIRLRGHGLPPASLNGLLASSADNEACVLETLYVPSRGRLERLLKEGALKPLNGGSFEALLAAAGAAGPGQSSTNLRFRLIYRGPLAADASSIPLIGGSCVPASFSHRSLPESALNSSSSFCISEDVESGASPTFPAVGAGAAASSAPRRRKTSPSINSSASLAQENPAASSSSNSQLTATGGSSAATSSSSSDPSAATGAAPTAAAATAAAAAASAIPDWDSPPETQQGATAGSIERRRGPSALRRCKFPAFAKAASFCSRLFFNRRSHAEVLSSVQASTRQQVQGCPVLDLELDLQASSHNRSAANSSAGSVLVDLDFAEVVASSPAVAIFCGPNAGIAELVHRCSHTIPLYGQAGADLLVLNYRGYGRSTGSPSPSRLQADAASICRFLRGSLGARKIIAHGESIGGVTACALASITTQAPPLTASLFSSSLSDWIRRQRNVASSSSTSSSSPSGALADAVVADRTLDTLSKTATEMVAPIAAFGLNLVSRWTSSNAAALLRAPASASAANGIGANAERTLSLPPSVGGMQTSLLQSPSSSAAGAAASDPYGQLVPSGQELASLDDLQHHNSPGSVDATSAVAVPVSPSLAIGLSSSGVSTSASASVLKFLLWDPNDEVIHWKGSLAVGVAEATAHAVVTSSSSRIPRPLASRLPLIGHAAPAFAFAVELQSLSARLYYLAVLWKRAAVRGMGSWSGANPNESESESSKGISLNAIPAFVGAGLSGFPGGAGLSSLSSTPSTASHLHSAPLYYVFEPAPLASAKHKAEIKAIERLSNTSSFPQIDRSRFPLLWQASIAEAKKCLFPEPLPPAELASYLGRDKLPFLSAPALIGKRQSSGAGDSDDDSAKSAGASSSSPSRILLQPPLGLLAGLEVEGGERPQTVSFALSVAARFGAARERMIGKHLNPSSTAGGSTLRNALASSADSGDDSDGDDDNENDDVASVLLHAVESVAGGSMTSVGHAAHAAAQSLHATAALTAGASINSPAAGATSDVFATAPASVSAFGRSALLDVDTAAFASFPYCVALALKGNMTGSTVTAFDARLSGPNGIMSQQFQQQQQYRALAASCASVIDAAVQKRLKFAGKRYRTGLLECLGEVATLPVAESFYHNTLSASTDHTSESQVPLELPLEVGVDAVALSVLSIVAVLNNGCGLSLGEALSKGWKGDESATGSGLSAFLSSGSIWGWPLQRGEQESVRHLKQLTSSTSTSDSAVAASSGWRLGRTSGYLLRAQEDSLSTCLRRLKTIQRVSRQQAAAGQPLETLYRFYSVLPGAAAPAHASGSAAIGSDPLCVPSVSWVREQLLCETIATLEEVKAWSNRLHAAVKGPGGGALAAMASPQGLLLPLTCGHNRPWEAQERQMVEMGLALIFKSLSGCLPGTCCPWSAKENPAASSLSNSQLSATGGSPAASSSSSSSDPSAAAGASPGGWQQ